jgi:hypothetical protein
VGDLLVSLWRCRDIALFVLQLYVEVGAAQRTLCIRWGVQRVLCVQRANKNL